MQSFIVYRKHREIRTENVMQKLIIKEDQISNMISIFAVNRRQNELKENGQLRAIPWHTVQEIFIHQLGSQKNEILCLMISGIK